MENVIFARLYTEDSGPKRPFEWYDAFIGGPKDTVLNLYSFWFMCWTWTWEHARLY